MVKKAGTLTALTVVLAGTFASGSLGATTSDCFTDYGGLVAADEVVPGNLVVTRVTDGPDPTGGTDPMGMNRGSICQIRGTVQGHVQVFDDSDACNTRPPFTAVELAGGKVLGNIKSEGNKCAMVWLRDGAFVDSTGASLVGGNVVVDAPGNLGFLGNGQGARVRGNSILNAAGSLLFATGASNANRVDGHIICEGGAPAGGPGTGDARNWDGLESSTDPGPDGTLGGRYAC